MRKTIWIATALLTTLILSGCQVINRPTPQPTPTAIYLVPAANPAPTGAPSPVTLPAPSSAAVPASPVPTPSPTARPTLSVQPAQAATAAPDRLMTLGIDPSVALRAAPNLAAGTIATLNGSQVLWAEGRTADGRWLRVTYGNLAAQAWVATAAVRVLGKADSLPVLAPEAIVPKAPAASVGAGKGWVARTLAPQLNVRSGPGLDQPVIGQLLAGAALAVAGRTDGGDWLAIRWPVDAPTTTAWVAASLVELTGQAADLPILGKQSTGIVPAAPVFSGKIAFETRSGGDIYVVNADGTGLRRVADGLDPLFSPDGKRLAFARWASPHAIFTLDLATGQEQQVVSANRPRSPTWNKDATQIVFSRVTRDNACRQTPLGCVDEAAIRQAFGGKECVDTPQGHFCISDFSPSIAEDVGLTVVNISDGSAHDWFAGPLAQSPIWRPGQDELLYRSKTGLQIFTPGSGSRSLIENVELGSPAWSPDGQRIAAQIYLHDHADIFLLAANGQTQKRLTQPATATKRAPNNVAPAWSPDGQIILFFSDRDGAWRLYRMNADGSDQTLFLPDALSALSFQYDFAAERMVTWSR